ncbi:uncharacterized protein LOC134675046 [Cydia fagiglandana]|uniref:uncharacterized protein LOC134675046 n=1 Tax=Cydia fagiglandana TaxID=1458189 RepID=UPI002FEE225F
MRFGNGDLTSEKTQGKDEIAINASIAHIVLSCVAGQGISHWNEINFIQPGMHGNLFLFGICGYLLHQSARFKINMGPVYNFSTRATRYLPIPCMMADLYKGNHLFAGLHLMSGLVPFSLSMMGTSFDSAQIGNLVIAGNIISLGHYSLENNMEWGFYTAAAAVFTYYLCPQSGPKIIYPFGLALMEYCAYRASKIKLERKKMILNFIVAVLLIIDPCGC